MGRRLRDENEGVETGGVQTDGVEADADQVAEPAGSAEPADPAGLAAEAVAERPSNDATVPLVPVSQVAFVAHVAPVAPVPPAAPVAPAAVVFPVGGSPRVNVDALALEVEAEADREALRLAARRAELENEVAACLIEEERLVAACNERSSSLRISLDSCRAERREIDLRQRSLEIELAALSRDLNDALGPVHERKSRAVLELRGPG